jgi:hypothetical protein
MAEASCRIGKFMPEIFSNIGKQMVGLGLIVGFIFAGLVGIILSVAFGWDKTRRFFHERKKTYLP